MSKSKKSKSKKAVKNTEINKKKKTPLSLKIGLGVLAVAVIAVAVVFFVNSNSAKNEIVGVNWVSVSAKDASSDEVDLQDIYDTNYSSYQGSLNFKSDGTFSLWLSPGAADDGTHSGKYRIESDSKISASFDDGETKETFSVNRSDGKIKSIFVPYGDYEVQFSNK